MEKLTATQKQRKSQGDGLKTLLLEKLKSKFNLEADTQIRLTNTSLEVFVMESENPETRLFGSEIEFFNSVNWNNGNDNLTINFGSTGSFTPSNRAPMVRTKHAMEFLNNWEEATELILEFMQQVKNLQSIWAFENKMAKDKK